MSPRLAFAVQTAEEAGRCTLQYFDRSGGFRLKGDNTPVTEADLEAERIVRERLAESFPGEHVLGEEAGGLDRPDRWVVDPIDGTKSFVAGVPLFATLLSYESQGEPVLGVAHFPALGETVWAERGEGCFRNGARCAVRTETDLARAVVCCGGLASMEAHGRLSPFVKFADRCLAARTWCDAYGHVLVATGRADAMVDPFVARWDISAIAVIVREAGGSFTDFAGREELGSEAVSCTMALRDVVLGVFAA